MAEPAPSFKANPRKPRTALPPGACDTHFHVFGPRARFPYATERGVVVQSAVHHFDNSAAADLLAANRNYYMGHLGKGDSVEAALEMAGRLADIGWHLQIHMDTSTSGSR